MDGRPSAAQGSQDKSSPSGKPPALISEKERRMREMERERADANLQEKKSENHQILKVCTHDNEPNV